MTESYDADRARQLREFCSEELTRQFRQAIAALNAADEVLSPESAERAYYLWAQQWRGSPEYKTEWDLKPYMEENERLRRVGAERRQFRGQK